MGKKGAFLANVALGSALTGVVICWLSPKAGKILKKDAEKRLDELSEICPDAVEFFKDKANHAIDFFKTIKDSVIDDSDDVANDDDFLDKLDQKAHASLVSLEEKSADLKNELSQKSEEVLKVVKGKSKDIILDVNDLATKGISKVTTKEATTEKPAE